MLKLVYCWKKFRAHRKTIHFGNDSLVDPKQHYKVNFHYKILELAFQLPT